MQKIRQQSKLTTKRDSSPKFTREAILKKRPKILRKTTVMKPLFWKSWKLLVWTRINKIFITCATPWILKKFSEQLLRKHLQETRQQLHPSRIYQLKVNNRNTRTRCEMCSKLTTKTPQRRKASFWCLYC